MSDNHHVEHHDETSSTGETIELIKSGAMKGAADAREVANRVWDNAGLFACRFLYTTSYTLSYGLVFPATLLARAVPRNNVAVSGLVDGARAAREKVDTMFAAEPEHPRLIITGS